MTSIEATIVENIAKYFHVNNTAKPLCLACFYEKCSL